MDPSDEAESSNAADKPANASHGRARFDADEAREVALRAELDGLRGINEVIEGVVSSLDRAKQNMEVGPLPGHSMIILSPLHAGGVPYRRIGFHALEYLDPNTLSDGA